MRNTVKSCYYYGAKFENLKLVQTPENKT